MSSQIKKRMHFTRALRTRSFALLWTGQTISRMGDFAYMTALAWQVLILTHSGTAMGIVLMASTIPQLIFLLIGGVAADRLPKLRVLLCSDAGRAITVIIIAALSWFHLLQLWHLLVLSLIFGIAQGFFIPAYQAIPPQLVDAESLPSANALNGLSRQVGTLAGPILGSALIVLAGPALAFAFDGITFAISALCIMLVHSKPQFVSSIEEDVSSVENVSQHGLQKVFLDIREGLFYVMRSPWLWVSILIAALANVAVGGAIQVAFPRLVKDFYHSGIWLLGALGPAESVGSILGTFFISQITNLHRRGIINYICLIIGSCGVALMGLPFLQRDALLAVISGGLLIGIGYSISSIIWVTVLQEIIPADKQGRVFSIDAIGSFGLQPLGYALVGIATDAVGPAPIFLYGGLANVLLSLLALFVRGIREID